MQEVVFDEWSEAGNIRQRISVAEAISRQYAVAASQPYRTFFYPDDQAALDDFLVIHWAWLEPAE